MYSGYPSNAYLPPTTQVHMHMQMPAPSRDGRPEVERTVSNSSGLSFTSTHSMDSQYGAGGGAPSSMRSLISASSASTYGSSSAAAAHDRRLMLSRSSSTKSCGSYGSYVNGQFDDAPEDMDTDKTTPAAAEENTLLTKETLKEDRRDNSNAMAVDTQYEDVANQNNNEAHHSQQAPQAHNRYHYQPPPSNISNNFRSTIMQRQFSAPQLQSGRPSPTGGGRPAAAGGGTGVATSPYRITTPSPPSRSASVSSVASSNTTSSNKQENESINALPPNREYVSVLNDNDVLCGRGKGVNDYVGNKRFRTLIRQYRDEYLHSSRGDKTNIARLIVEIVRQQSPSGRFLKKVPNSRYWYVVEKQVALEKTSQALREGSPRHLICSNNQGQQGQGQVQGQPQQQHPQQQQRQQQGPPPPQGHHRHPSYVSP